MGFEIKIMIGRQLVGNFFKVDFLFDCGSIDYNSHLYKFVTRTNNSMGVPVQVDAIFNYNIGDLELPDITRDSYGYELCACSLDILEKLLNKDIDMERAKNNNYFMNVISLLAALQTIQILRSRRNIDDFKFVLYGH